MRSYPRIAAGVSSALALTGALGLTGATSVAAASALPQGSAAPAADQQQQVAPADAALGHATSRNWAGYVSLPHGSTKTFTTISSTWVQPKVTCSSPDAWTVFWVGLDGWLDGTVEQGGSSARCVNGVPHYQTWWETYPTNSIQLVNTIRAGDKITATVTYSPGSHVYTVVVRDDTTGKAFTKKAMCAKGANCQRSSAEVIAEDVGHYGAGSYFPLAKYSPTTFSGTTIKNQSGKAGAFASTAWLNDAITEASGGTTYATVGPLSDQGKRFTATWRHK